MAGKGFTVRKEWDNPIEHAMPAEARVPAEVRLGSVLVAPATCLRPWPGLPIRCFGGLFVMPACLRREPGNKGTGNEGPEIRIWR